MADKKISDLTAQTAMAATDVMEVATATPASKKITWANMGLSFGDGAAATPSIAFASDPNTGLSWVSAGIMAVSGDGLEVCRFSAPAGATPQILLADGSAAKAAIAFTADATLGLWRSAANTISLTTGGVTRISFATAGLTFASGSSTLTCASGATLTLTSTVSTAAGPAVTLGNQNSFTGSTAITQLGATCAHTVNQSSTAGFTAFTINTTQTAVGSGQQVALDCQIAAVSKFTVFAQGAHAIVAGTPATMGTTENDYAASGVVDRGVVRLTGHASNTVITGILAPVATPVGGVAAGQFKWLVNIAAPTITINNQDAGSAAANRIQTSTGAAVVLSQHDTMLLWYDATSGYWRQLTTAA